MIAVFDSGVGGLGILREIVELGCTDDIMYLADRANAPYGVRSLDEVRTLTHRHAASAIGAGASTVVVACNTASAAALKSLRAQYPGTRFVGMEPAIKPAATFTKSGKIGVLATSATFQGKLFASLVGDYGTDVEVMTATAPEWVQFVEAGELSGSKVKASVEARVQPLLDAGADVLVLGCTHFPFLLTALTSAVDGRASLIDPAPAVAQQTLAVHRSTRTNGVMSAVVSGDIEEFTSLASDLVGAQFPGGVLPLATE